jgi:hypothetical protein
MVFSYREHRGDFPVNANRAINARSIPQTTSVRSFAKATPLAVTLLIWLFAVSLETGYVAVLNAGIQSTSQAVETV